MRGLLAELLHVGRKPNFQFQRLYVCSTPKCKLVKFSASVWYLQCIFRGGHSIVGTGDVRVELIFVHLGFTSVFKVRRPVCWLELLHCGRNRHCGLVVGARSMRLGITDT